MIVNYRRFLRSRRRKKRVRILQYSVSAFVQTTEEVGKQLKVSCYVINLLRPALLLAVVTVPSLYYGYRIFLSMILNIFVISINQCFYND